VLEQALARCDCFCTLPHNASTTCSEKTQDSDKVCVLQTPFLTYQNCDRDDPSYMRYRAIGRLEVALYGMGVPLLYFALICACKGDIEGREIEGNGDESPRMAPLADALSFLHSAFKPRWPFYWWPLVEAARTLVLTGILAGLPHTGLYPGTVTQLFVGLVVAIGFAIFQIYMEPYKRNSVRTGSSDPAIPGCLVCLRPASHC
jgi:hypothetical protein